MKTERSIIFQTTNNVPPILIEAGANGLTKAMTLIPGYSTRFLLPKPIVGSFQLPKPKQSCRGPQFDVGRLAETVNSLNNNSGKYWNVVLCNHDLYQTGDGWVFASTIADVISVISVARFMNPNLSDSEKDLAVTRLVAHEVGHLLGLVERSYDAVESYGLHCTNVCIMRQALTPKRWIRSALEERESSVDFCASCQGEMFQCWTQGA